MTLLLQLKLGLLGVWGGGGWGGSVHTLRVTFNLRVCVTFLFSHTHVDQSDDVSGLVIGGE